MTLDRLISELEEHVRRGSGEAEVVAHNPSVGDYDIEKVWLDGSEIVLDLRSL